MDVNGTRHHAVFGRSDWEALGLTGRADVRWDPLRGGVVLGHRQVVLESAAGTPEPERRRGAAADRFGHWYWLGEDAEGGSVIWFAPSAEAPRQRFWPRAEAEACRARADFEPAAPAEDEAQANLRGLAVTEDHYLVAGSLTPPGLWVFDLWAGGPPVRFTWPEQLPFRPFDLAPRPGGGVVILDRAPGSHARLWARARRVRVVERDGAAALVPEDEEDVGPARGPPRTRPALTFPRGQGLELAVALDGPEAMALEALPDGSVLVLSDRGAFSALARYLGGRQVGPTLPLDRALEPHRRPGALSAQDLAFLPDPAIHGGEAGSSPASPRSSFAGTLYLGDASGREAHAFTLRLGAGGALLLEHTGEELPLFLWGRRALTRGPDGVYHDRTDDRFLRVSSLPRARHRTEGRLPGRVFDGKASGCVWHRLFLDGVIPPGCAVEVEARASDELGVLGELPWQPQPAPYLRPRGSELVHQRRLASPRAGEGTFELLFQEVKGRHLELRLTLRGTGRATPLLAAMRVYYPRFSYLERYLPAIYREEPTSASFLDRFLANAEGMLTELEGRVAAAELLFDVRTVPADYLEWLGGWLGAIFEPGWDEPRRRLFLRHAPQAFRERGTRRGLETLLALATVDAPTDALFARGPCCAPTRGVPRIVERFLTRTAAGHRAHDPETAPLDRGAGEGRWLPSDGREVLLARHRRFVAARHGTPAALAAAWAAPITPFEALPFSAVRPQQGVKARDWRSFLDLEVGVPWASVEPLDLPAWQSFLAQRHPSASAYGEAHGVSIARFDQIILPAEDELPADGRPLEDWLLFVSQVLPRRNAAHRFSVLVPAHPEEPAARLEQRLARAEAVARRERPAHTDFEVRLFWDLFRVGMARVGQETELGAGARLLPLVLDRRHLAEGTLTAEPPWTEADRNVLGRDGLTGEAST